MAERSPSTIASDFNPGFVDTAMNSMLNESPEVRKLESGELNAEMQLHKVPQRIMLVESSY